ncbi:MAG TPA: copper-binding protein [Bryobacteraceae bacterium]|jgi:Cu/Ag efflux protein CusF|nr:copper-binding protein [Bryobacteraceae bacterium]
MTGRLTVILVLAAALTGCRAKLPEGKRYPMQGEIKALDPTAKSATIDAGDIGDWMTAMTMEYPVKPDADFQKLHVGDHIQATVVVSEPGYYVTDVKIVKQ